jgi:hypothetical protein
MKFSSRKSLFFRFLIFGLAALFAGLYIYVLVYGWIEQRDFWIVIPIGIVIGFLLWIYFGTNYELTDKELIYKSGPLRGRIRIDEIREIVKGKTLYAGFKPATAEKGLIVKFRKYDEIYISPNSNESFIEAILERNPAILISQ